MRTEPNDPWWLAAGVTALPVALAVVLVVVFPPGYKADSAKPAPATATQLAMTDPGNDIELCVLAASR